MKRLLIAAFALLISSSANVMAQNSDSDKKNREENMKKMTTEQAQRLAKEMKLDDAKTKTFTDLYVEYRTKEMELRFASMNKANRERGEKKEGKKAETMTDAQADSLITATFSRTQKELDLKKEYYEKFRKDFTPSQLVKVFAAQPRFDRNGARSNRNGQGGNFNGGGRGGFGGQGNGGGFGGPDMGGGF